MTNQNRQPASPGSMTIMTYNLRYAVDPPPNDWQTRGPLVGKCIRAVNPDLIGTQEGLYHQLKDLEVQLPEYSWIGLGREGGSRGEFMAIFYRRLRFELLEFDHFWLSDTPEVIGSTTWGNEDPRMVTWLRLKERRARQQFYFFNTHLDRHVELARRKGAELILQRVEELREEWPVILTGDFNAPAEASEPYELLVSKGPFVDTWTTAKSRTGEGLGTSNKFEAMPWGEPRIDWVLTCGSVESESSEIVTLRYHGRFPSDHCPVVARIRM